MLEEMFASKKIVLGVIHLLPLPGSPRYDGQLERVFQRAEQEAAALATGGVDGIVVENFFDAPFVKNRVDTVTACSMTVAVQRVRSITNLPLGINVLRNDGHTALAIAAVAGADFIRVNVFCGAMLTDQGVIEGEAHDLLMYKKSLSLSRPLKIFADVMVKHAQSIGLYPNIGHLATDTVKRGLADAVIVSGAATGATASMQDLKDVRAALPNSPILIGSGANRENVSELLQVADGIIVASSLKRQGILENPVDPGRVRDLIQEVRRLSD